MLAETIDENKDCEKGLPDHLESHYYAFPTLFLLLARPIEIPFAIGRIFLLLSLLFLSRQSAIKPATTVVVIVVIHAHRYTSLLPSHGEIEWTGIRAWMLAKDRVGPNEWIERRITTGWPLGSNRFDRV